MNLFTSVFPLLFSVLFFLGCKKEGGDLKEEQEMKTTAARAEGAGGCQVTKYHYYDAIHDHEQIEEFTYKNGRVDEWASYYGVVYKMEYSVNGKMKIARAYYNGQIISTIRFIYSNNKVVKEIWYVGNTQDIDDEVINTFNERGQLIKSQSIAYDYIVLNKYTAQGYLESWHYFVGGVSTQKGEYTYNEEIKNPYVSARPGIDYNFAWVNSAFGSGHRWYSSEKIILFDGNGDPFVYYDQDASKTLWQKGQQNNPLRADYVDAISGGSIINSFEYINCPGSNSNNLTESLVQKSGANKNKMDVSRIRPLLHGPQKEVIQLVKEMRKQH